MNPTRQTFLISSLKPKRKISALVAVIFFSVHFANAVTFQIVDPAEFSKIINTNAIVTTNYTINSPLEGPVWVPSDGGYLVFSDMGNNRLKKLVLPGTVTDFYGPPANTLFNGNLLDGQERLVSCQGGNAGLRVVTTTTNGVVTGLASTCNGLKFYSPNDLAVKSDGTIWFTDPGYNSSFSQPPVPGGFQTGYYVYQFNPTNGNATCTPVITNGLIRPNGICFSPDQSKLYVADSDSSRHRIQVYSVSASNTLSGGAVFATLPNGFPDGIRCDVNGRVWSSGGDGAYIFAPDGHLIGKIRFGKVVNLCFGGPRYETLYITAQPMVASFPVLVAGTPSLKTLKPDFDGSRLNLRWPAPSTGFALQEAGQLDPSAAWTDMGITPIVTNAQNLVSVEVTNAVEFFRLRLN
jgi:gluconolactonase